MMNFLSFILNFGSVSCREERSLECDTYRTCEECIKVELEKHDTEIREMTIDECKNIVKKFIGYLDEDMIGRINLKLEQLKRREE